MVIVIWSAHDITVMVIVIWSAHDITVMVIVIWSEHDITVMVIVIWSAHDITVMVIVIWSACNITGCQLPNPFPRTHSVPVGSQQFSYHILLMPVWCNDTQLVHP